MYGRLLTPPRDHGMRLASTFDFGPDEVLTRRTGSHLHGDARRGRIMDRDPDPTSSGSSTRSTGWSGVEATERRDGDRMRRGRYGISGVAAAYGLACSTTPQTDHSATPGTIESTHQWWRPPRSHHMGRWTVNGEYGEPSDLKSISRQRASTSPSTDPQTRSVCFIRRVASIWRRQFALGWAVLSASFGAWLRLAQTVRWGFSGSCGRGLARTARGA